MANQTITPTAVDEIPVPNKSDEYADLMSEFGHLIAQDPDGAQELARKFAKAAHVHDPSVNEQAVEMRVETTKESLLDALGDEEFAEQAFARLARQHPEMLERPTMDGPAKGPKDITPELRYNPVSPGADADGVFASFGEYLQAVWHGEDGPSELAGKLDQVRKIQAAYSSDLPWEGGALIPEEFRSTLMETRLESEIVRPRATVIPMGSKRIEMPAVDDKDRSGGTTHGGIQVYWESEAASLTASEATFETIGLETKKLTAYTEVPSELPADAPAFGAFIARAYPQAMAWKRDIGFIDGNGAKEPVGFHDEANAAKITVTRAGASNLAYEDALRVVQQMLPESMGSTVWLANLDCMKEIYEFELSTGSPAVMISPLTQAPQPMLLGRPIIFSEKIPALGSAFDLGLYDLSQYLVGDRQAIQVARSTDYKFRSDEEAFRVIERLDGKPWMSANVQPYKGANNLSWAVGVAA